MSKRILIVDDEVDVAELLQVYFLREGFEVTIANDGEQAAALLSSHAFDLVVTDLFMPKKDGLEVIRELQKKSKTKVIAISGGGRALGSKVFLETAQLLGADKILEKPFDCKDLVAAARELLA